MLKEFWWLSKEKQFRLVIEVLDKRKTKIEKAKGDLCFYQVLTSIAFDKLRKAIRILRLSQLRISLQLV